jgi:hypothetical protein
MPSIREIIEANSIPEPNSGCLIWLRGVSNGYPVWKWEGRRRQVSHLALEAKGIVVPKGFDACHSCDVTLCVNDDHLFVGTRTVNMQDASAKGRLVGYGKREFCKQGHPMSGDNLRVYSGKRRCHTCMLEWGRIVDAKRRGSYAAT